MQGGATEASGVSSEPAVTALREALSALEARGARNYDAPACDCVRALIERGEELGGRVAERLGQRARAHLDALTARFERDLGRLETDLHAWEGRIGEQPRLRKRLAQGELLPVARRLRRYRTMPPEALTTLEAQPSPGAARGARPMSLRRQRAVAYEDSVAQLVAALALARANDGVPSDAGPYNPLRIASDLLDRMREISPFYLAVQLNRLEELGSLLSLPELPDEPPEPPAIPGANAGRQVPARRAAPEKRRRGGPKRG